MAETAPLPTVPPKQHRYGRNLRAAIISGATLGGIVIAALFIPYAWYPLVAVATFAATVEVCRPLRQAGYVLPIWPLVIGGQAMIWLSFFYGTRGITSGFIVTVLGIMVLRLGTQAREKHGVPVGALSNYTRDTAVAIFIATWIPLFAAFAAQLSKMRTNEVSGWAFILTMMLVVVASDVGGFAFGVKLGRHPMAPAISPKKSWEGFVGSLCGGIAVGSLCCIFLLDVSPWIGVVIGVSLVVAATLGDLLESQFKRDLGIKDMSQMIPGHGGLMDRLDGMLPAAAMTWLILTVYGF